MSNAAPAQQTKKLDQLAPHTFTIIELNRESPFSIQLPGKESKAGIQLGPTVQLKPGVNFIPTDQWTEAKRNPTVLKYLEEKIAPSKSPETNPERVGHRVLVEGGQVSKDNPLASLEEKDAIELVGEIFDVPMAKRLLDEENRPKVVTALRAQINSIENPVVRKQ